MKRVALIVWIKTYSDPAISPLHYTDRDAARTAISLQTLLGFDSVQVIQAEQATHQAILKKVKEMASALAPGDLFLFYFSGHAVQVARGQAPKLACVGADLEVLEEDAGDYLPVGTLISRLKRLPGIHSVLILDSCRGPLAEGAKALGSASGNIASGVADLVRDLKAQRKAKGSRTQRSSVTTLCSCSPGTKAHESHVLEGGVFTVSFWNAVEALCRSGSPVRLSSAFVLETVQEEMERLGVKAGLGPQEPTWDSDTDDAPYLSLPPAKRDDTPPRRRPEPIVPWWAKPWAQRAVILVVAALLAAGLVSGWRPWVTNREKIDGATPHGGVVGLKALVAVQDLRIDPGTNAGLALTWKGEAPAYRVWRSAQPDLSRAEVRTLTSVTGTEYVDEQPLPGRSHYWVQGVRDTEEGPKGEPAEAWVLIPPTNVVASRGWDGVIDLTWSAPPVEMPSDIRFEVWAQFQGDTNRHLVNAVGAAANRFRYEAARTGGIYSVSVGVRGVSTRWGTSPLASAIAGRVEPPRVGRLGGLLGSSVVYWPTNIEGALRYEWVEDGARMPGAPLDATTHSTAGGTSAAPEQGFVTRWSPEDPQAALTYRDVTGSGAQIPAPAVRVAARRGRIEALNAGGRTPATEWVEIRPTLGTPFVNSLGQRFVPVPGTAVLFCIWETRVKDFEVFARETGHEWSSATTNWVYTGLSWEKPGFPEDPEHPVFGISYVDATRVAAWLTERDRKAGLLSATERYRLPTDREWSVAVGLGAETGTTPQDRSEKIPGVYPWGTSWPPPKGAGNFADAAAKAKRPGWSMIEGYDDGWAETSPVGSFSPNGMGLYDLAGNVWEWCEDYYYGKEGSRVLRGGSWFDIAPRRLLSSYRYYGRPGDRSHIMGFRLVVERDEAAPR